jgi:hypothetical protein
MVIFLSNGGGMVGEQPKTRGYYFLSHDNKQTDRSGALSILIKIITFPNGFRNIT